MNTWVKKETKGKRNNKEITQPRAAGEKAVNRQEYFYRTGGQTTPTICIFIPVYKYGDINEVKVGRNAEIFY